ncbi:hypothetical protein ACLB2K_011067 [Fragaria x ananassa]
MNRNLNKTIGGGRRCDENSTDPPCTGFVEMTAPVFSRASWRCVWHMIQTNAEEQDQAAKNTSLPTLEQLAPSQSSPYDPRTELPVQSNPMKHMKNQKFFSVSYHAKINVTLANTAENKIPAQQVRPFQQQLH